jgi:hypothetical protein
MRSMTRQRRKEVVEGVTGHFCQNEQIHGLDDTVKLEYVHEVGVRERPKWFIYSPPSLFSSKKCKSRINRRESLNRLADLEAERPQRVCCQK